MLSTPSRSFAPLVEPLITPQTIPNTLVIILLDWTEPHAWLRKLQKWILLLRTVFLSLGPKERDAMEELMVSWRNRGREGSSVQLDGTVGNTSGDADEDLRLGSGEWEDALGLPLCVVCQNVCVFCGWLPNPPPTLPLCQLSNPASLGRKYGTIREEPLVEGVGFRSGAAVPKNSAPATWVSESTHPLFF